MEYTMKLLIKIILFFCVSVTPLYAAGTCGTSGKTGTTPFTSNSLSHADVDACVNTHAASGETVILPAGSATWSSTLSVTNPIIIQGQTSGCPSSCDGATTITADGVRLITIGTSGDEAIDISGLTLDANSFSELLRFYNTDGANPTYSVRIHNNEFLNCTSIALYQISGQGGLLFGLIDNNKFTDNYMDMKFYGDGADTWTDFPASDNYGSKEYVYIEDNVSTGFYYEMLASGEGARWVFRYNSVDGTATASGDTFFDAHGDTRNRGVVAIEIYENTFPNSEARRGIYYRGGGGIIFNNKWGGDSTYGGRIQPTEENEACNACAEGSPNCDVGLCWYEDGDSTPCGDEINNAYMWNNSLCDDVNCSGGTGALMTIEEADTYGCLAEDENWWDDVGAGDTNFTTGVFASRPSGSVDDSYYATDTETLYNYQGSAWVEIYTPYTYPHPLRGESTPTNTITGVSIN